MTNDSATTDTASLETSVMALVSDDRPRNLAGMNNDVLLLITDELNFLDLTRLRGVSKMFRALVSQQQLINGLQELHDVIGTAYGRDVYTQIVYNKLLRDNGYLRVKTDKLFFPCHGCLQFKPYDPVTLGDGMLFRSIVGNQKEPCDLRSLSHRSRSLSSTICNIHGHLCKFRCYECLTTDQKFLSGGNHQHRWLVRLPNSTHSLVHCTKCNHIKTYTHREQGPRVLSPSQKKNGVCHECWPEHQDRWTVNQKRWFDIKDRIRSRLWDVEAPTHEEIDAALDYGTWMWKLDDITNRYQRSRIKLQEPPRFGRILEGIPDWTEHLQ